MRPLHAIRSLSAGFARHAFLQTLNGGVDKLKEMANGLSYTAAGGQGTGLQDIKIGWDDPYQAQYGR